MMWRLLTKDEIKREYPRQTTPILAAVAETSEAGVLWADTCFVLYADGILQIPHAELPIDDLITITQLLRASVSDSLDPP